VLIRVALLIASLTIAGSFWLAMTGEPFATICVAAVLRLGGGGYPY
jgi:hypothetical protein